MAYYQLEMIGDGGIPKTYSAYAECGISGGYIVRLVSGAQATALGSSVSTFIPSIIRVDIDSTSGTDGNSCGGIALKSVASGGIVPIAYDGLFILESSAAITAGAKIVSTTSGTNQGQVGIHQVGSPVWYTGQEIGTALTQGADGEFVVVRLNI